MTMRPLTGREQQLIAAVSHLPDEPSACTKCRTRTAFTEDWTLYPWPDGAWLCHPCNEERWAAEPDAFARLTEEGGH